MNYIVRRIFLTLNKCLIYTLFIVFFFMLCGCSSMNKQYSDLRVQNMEVGEKNEKGKNLFENGIEINNDEEDEGCEKENDFIWGVDSSNVICYSCDPVVYEYPLYKDFVEGTIPAIYGTKSIYWIEHYSYRGELNISGISFFVKDFDSDDDMELGIVTRRENGICDLEIAKKFEGEVHLLPCSETIEDPFCNMETRFYDNGFCYKECLEEHQISEDVVINSESKSLCVVEESGVTLLMNVSYFYNELNNTFDFSFIDGDEYTTIQGAICKNGMVEYSTEEEKMINMFTKEFEDKVNAMVSDSFESMKCWIPIKENGAEEVMLRDVF